MNRQLFNAMVAQYGTKTVSANDAVEWSGGAHCYLPSVKFYGNTEQVGTPTPDAPVTIKSFNGFYQSDNTSIVVPTLNGIGGYEDEWDYVTGKGLRRIHKVVLDGVSKYGKLTSYTVSETRRGAWLEKLEFMPARKQSTEIVLSTHFKTMGDSTPGNTYVGNNLIYLIFDNTLYPNTTACNAWLAEQYANGTPVVVYYAVAEPIPFAERPDTYTPIPNDSGRISFGDGTMSAVPFEVSYITHS